MAKTLLIQYDSGSDSLDALYDLARRQIERRCDANVVNQGPAGETLRLELSPDVGAESFEIADGGDHTVRIRAGDQRGLVYGMGKFLRTSRYEEGIEPSSWRGACAPDKPLRGIYLASHFHNWYHEAPTLDVAEYVEELALWGINAIVVWFDMHHYTGIADPDALAMIERLKAVLTAAKRIGIGAALGFLANEAYANSPVEMRADWTSGHDGYHHTPGGHYHVELCPNKPGATELMLGWAAEKLEVFGDIGIDYVWLWPYDQGGCTCSQCKPWGANGFLQIAEPMARMIKEKQPGAQVILSTWYFDHFTDGEWEGLDAALSERPDWADYLLADDNADEFPPYPLQHGVPGGLPMVNFSEISMYRMGPWGGYGANPFPSHLQAVWDQAKTALAGGFPYSEGCYDDINKVICAGFYWDGDRAATESVRQYISYECGISAPGDIDALSEAIALIESAHARTSHPDHESPGNSRFVLQQQEGVARAWAVVQDIEARLPHWARVAWRWRILYLRALIDNELVENDGRVSDRCERALSELTAMYHAEKAAYWVAPPTIESIVANRKA